MDEIFLYFTDLPDHVNEMIASGPDGYSVYIDSRLSEEERYKAFLHAVKHIEHNEHWYNDVQITEAEAHDVQPEA